MKERYRVLIRLESASTGAVAAAGEVIERGGFLAPCSDDDINLLLKRGAIQFVETYETVIDEPSDEEA